MVPTAGARWALCAGAVGGGCSFSYQLENLFAKKDDVKLCRRDAPAAPAKPVADLPPEGDLNHRPGGGQRSHDQGRQDASVSWRIPRPEQRDGDANRDRS